MLLYDSVGCQKVYKNHNNLTKVQAVEAVETFLRFAKDNARDKSPRRGRNPQTGETHDLDARRVSLFIHREFYEGEWRVIHEFSLFQIQGRLCELKALSPGGMMHVVSVSLLSNVALRKNFT